jgi:hypothetical protein
MMDCNTEQSQLSSSYDCHSHGSVLFALCGHVSESVICGLNSGILQKNKELIFMGYYPLVDVVGLMVRQWLLVQRPEPFEDCLSAGMVFSGLKKAEFFQRQQLFGTKLLRLNFY